jgi:hypothetical protein
LEVQREDQAVGREARLETQKDGDAEGQMETVTERERD